MKPKITLKSSNFWSNYDDDLLKEILCMKKAKSYLAMTKEGKRQMKLIHNNKFKNN